MPLFLDDDQETLADTVRPFMASEAPVSPRDRILLVSPLAALFTKPLIFTDGCCDAASIQDSKCGIGTSLVLPSPTKSRLSLSL